MFEPETKPIERISIHTGIVNVWATKVDVGNKDERMHHSLFSRLMVLTY